MNRENVEMLKNYNLNTGRKNSTDLDAVSRERSMGYDVKTVPYGEKPGIPFSPKFFNKVDTDTITFSITTLCSISLNSQ